MCMYVCTVHGHSECCVLASPMISHAVCRSMLKSSATQLPSYPPTYVEINCLAIISFLTELGC